MGPRSRRVIASVSRRAGRPELLATFDALGRRELRDAVAQRVIMASLMRPDSTFIDVGANQGEWTRLAVEYAPSGTHYAFEPIPALAAQLRQEFSRITIRQVAAYSEAGHTQFCYFPTMAGWSGLQKRPRIAAEHAPEWIDVVQNTLDDELADVTPTVVKIDVEGAELAVVRGARELLRRSRATVVFEHEREASALYGFSSEELWLELDGLGLRVFDLQGHGPYDRAAFSSVPDEAVVDWLAVPSE
jgi:FkbM family methyltransferase